MDGNEDKKVDDKKMKMTTLTDGNSRGKARGNWQTNSMIIWTRMVTMIMWTRRMLKATMWTRMVTIM